jgi:predicted HNH restriction endonuclease
MGKKLPYTPSSQIRTALRRLWLRSRERSAAMKREGYRCQCCGIKQSKARGHECNLEVHHRNGVTNWQEIEKAIRWHLLVAPVELEVLCPDCHKKEHTEG